MKSKLLSILFMLFSFSLFAKNVSNGVINFEHARAGKKIIRLSGDWEFYKGQTFSNLSTSQLKIDFIQVPGTWKKNSVNSKIPSYGSNTYRVLIRGLHPDTEYGIYSRSSPALVARIFANGKFIATYGEFSRHEMNYKPLQKPMLCTFFSDEMGSIELVIQVTNFDQRDGGILSPIMFGFAKDVSKLHSDSLFILAMITGMVIFIFLANFLIWFFDKTHIQGLYFSLFLLVLILRITVGDFNALSDIFMTINYNVQVKLQNIILLSFGFFSLVYRLDNFFSIKHPYIDKTISFVSLGCAILLFCLPLKLTSYVCSVLIVISMLFFIYSIYRLFLCLKVRNYYVAIYTIFYFVVFSGIILDIFFDGPREDMLLNYTEISVIVLTCIVVIYLAVYLEFLVRNYLNQKNNLSERYIAYRKFVPSDLPHILNKESFGKINLGDNSEITSTIVSIETRIMPPDNTQISLREQFETMGFYSSKIVEIIEEYEGIVLSITGKGLTVLFRASTNDALSAACEIRELLDLMNERRKQDYYPYASFNIALHYGSIIIGVIGSEYRIDHTIVSPNIELAENLCTLARQKEIPIIVSESAANNLEEFDMSILRPLGRVKFREISYPINLYGVVSFKDFDEPAKLEVPRIITQRDVDRYIDI